MPIPPSAPEGGVPAAEGGAPNPPIDSGAAESVQVRPNPTDGKILRRAQRNLEFPAANMSKK